MGAAAAASAMFQVAGGITQANAARRQARAEQAELNFAAKEKDRQANLTEIQTKENLRRFGIQTKKSEGANIASIGASGITTEGSAMDVLAENAMNAELDKVNIQFEGSERARTLRAEAAANRRGVKTAGAAGRTGAAAALFQTGAGLAETFKPGK